MKYTLKAKPYIDLVDGGINASFYLDNCSDCPLNEDIDDFENLLRIFENMNFSDDFLSLEIDFSIGDLLQNEMVLNVCSDGSYSMDSKPTFDATRKVLVGLIEKIDAMKFI